MGDFYLPCGWCCCLQGGDLRKALSADRSGRLLWYSQGKEVMMDVVRGLHFLHANNVVHRDGAYGGRWLQYACSVVVGGLFGQGSGPAVAEVSMAVSAGEHPARRDPAAQLLACRQLDWHFACSSVVHTCCLQSSRATSFWTATAGLSWGTSGWPS